MAADVVAAMLPYFSDLAANPASVHRPGQLARRGLERAREQVAASVSAGPDQVVFTSGATEAANHALRVVMASRPGGRLVTSLGEHAAVLETARSLERSGVPVTYLELAADGSVGPDALTAAMGPDVALVALMLVNNETGVLSDLPALSAIAKSAGALVFCDAVQGYGFQEFDSAALGADLVAISAHKVYGPKGVGALVTRPGLALDPLLFGGAQERGVRPGTHNLPAIVGFGRAAELAGSQWRRRAAQFGSLRDRLEISLTAIDGVTVNGGASERGPKHLNVSVTGVDGEDLFLVLDDLSLYVSSGSACAAGSLEPSHVLTAMGHPPQLVKASVRFSLGVGLDGSLVDEAAARFQTAVARCRTRPPPMTAS